MEVWGSQAIFARRVLWQRPKKTTRATWPNSMQRTETVYIVDN